LWEQNISCIRIIIFLVRMVEIWLTTTSLEIASRERLVSHYELLCNPWSYTPSISNHATNTTLGTTPRLSPSSYWQTATISHKHTTFEGFMCVLQTLFNSLQNFYLDFMDNGSFFRSYYGDWNAKVNYLEGACPISCSSLSLTGNSLISFDSIIFRNHCPGPIKAFNSPCRSSLSRWAPLPVDGGSHNLSLSRAHWTQVWVLSYTKNAPQTLQWDLRNAGISL